jgi:hypothetical protein
VVDVEAKVIAAEEAATVYVIPDGKTSALLLAPATLSPMVSVMLAL